MYAAKSVWVGAGLRDAVFGFTSFSFVLSDSHPSRFITFVLKPFECNKKCMTQMQFQKPSARFPNPITGYEVCEINRRLECNYLRMAFSAVSAIEHIMLAHLNNALFRGFVIFKVSGS
jgi:hypothetical protein